MAEERKSGDLLFTDVGETTPSDDRVSEDEADEMAKMSKMTSEDFDHDNAAVVAMDSALKIIVQDTNGEDCYSSAKAVMGYLEAGKFLYVPRKFHDAHQQGVNISVEDLGKVDGFNDYTTDEQAMAAYRANNAYHHLPDTCKDANGVELITTQILAMNYRTLKLAGLKPSDAFTAAAFRARWCATGAYGTLVDDGLRGDKEVTLVDGGHEDHVLRNMATAESALAVLTLLGKDLSEFLQEFRNADHGMSWVIRHSENSWAAVEHCFRVRGHHFKVMDNNTYDDLYTRYLTACYEGSFVWPAEVDMFSVFHTAIHPFAIRALPIMTAHYAAHGKIARAAVIRLSGSPNGNAAITTAHAALNTMRSEIWWRHFNGAYAGLIRDLNDFAGVIQDNKYQYHTAASLYGVQRLYTVESWSGTYGVEDAKARVSGIAAAAQGMIQALKEAVAQKAITGFALANSIALEKPAKANPMLTIKIRALIGHSLNSIADASSVAEAIANALPGEAQVEAEINNPRNRRPPVATITQG